MLRSKETIRSSPQVTQVFDVIANTSSPTREQTDKITSLMFPPDWLKANPNYQNYVPLPAESVSHEIIQRQLKAALSWISTGTCNALSNITQPTLVTVQTLSNHTYAARRSWRLKMTTNPNEYVLETVEANSFPWLVDYYYEELTGGEEPLVLWERFLTEFVRQNKGVIVDGTLIDGRKTTFNGDLKEILSKPIVEQALSEHPLIAEEVDRLRI